MVKLGFLSQVNESALLDGLPDDERRVLYDRLDNANIVMSRGMAPLMGIFVLLLWLIDLKRSLLGLLQSSVLYQFYAGTHLAYTLGVMLAAWLWLQRHSSRATQRTLLRAHMILMIGSVLLMAMASMYERNSLVILAVALLMANLMYQIPRTARGAVNFLALSIFTLMVFRFDHRDELTTLIQFGELLALILTAALVGGLHSRHLLTSMLAEHRLEQMAMLDALTGLASRRRLDEVLQRELREVALGRNLSVVLIDLDHFKRINDLYGHAVGDEVLRDVTRVLQQEGRLADVIGRWGGEEFLIVCTDTDLHGATALAERAAVRLRHTSISTVGRVTASAGVAQASAGQTIRDLLAQADSALYQAKAAGRDRVVRAPDPGSRASD